MTRRNLSNRTPKTSAPLRPERGAALTMALLVMALVGVMSIAVLSLVGHEARISGSDMERTQTFYASSAGLEKMTHDFSDLFRSTPKPTTTQMNDIANDPPDGLEDEGFTFKQSLARDEVLLAALKAANGNKSPTTRIPNGPFADMYASLEPFHLTSLVTHDTTGTQVKLERDINNYMIPLFQFATFSDGDLEFWPQPPMTFKGRVHANGNIYFGGDVTFFDRVTTAAEAVRNKLRNNASNTTTVGGLFASDPRFKDNAGHTGHLTIGSVVNGPKLTPQPRADGRGDFTGSPDGTDNSTSWLAKSLLAMNATNVNDQFGGMLLTARTGARELLLPLQIDGRAPFEIIKRKMDDDNDTMKQSRYHTKAEIRILIDDEALPTGVTSNAAGIPSNKGVLLSQWIPSELDGGNALRVVNDSGNYVTTSADWYQGDTSNTSTKKKALTVRAVTNSYIGNIVATGANAASGGTYAKTTNTPTSEYAQNLAKPNTYTGTGVPKATNGTIIPPGSGIKGRILIEIVKDGVATDVTQTILSMGVTVGEPNAIVHLQRPLWAAFMQGSRDRMGGNTYLTYFMENNAADKRSLADGEIKTATTNGLTFNNAGFINTTDANFDDDPHGSTAATYFTPTVATMSRDDKPPTTGLNQIVPINVYNVREGHILDSLTTTNVFTRGITSVVELNMRNLARWVDGAYDKTLLKNLPAASTNMSSPDGWIVYVSDRRGDRPKAEKDSKGKLITTTNGMVDNEDIYNYPGTLGGNPDPGEDVIDVGFDYTTGVNKNKKGSLQRDTLEMPDPTPMPVTSAETAPATYSDTVASGLTTRYKRSIDVAKFATSNQTAAGTAGYYFRRAVRLFNGENLMLSGGSEKLSATKGLTVASENMIYIWGNYNTTGINGQPTGDSTENDPDRTPQPTNRYLGNQVPASIAADAFFPLSKTWYDAISSEYPEGANSRIADAGSTTASAVIGIGQETSVRAGIISGTTLSAMVGTSAPTNPLQWLNGGVHNFPRFLETWGVSGGWEKRWNYAGSFIVLYNSTQALGPWSVTNSVNYSPPTRNWAFDVTFTNPNKLPPGTPQFQFVQATAFREVPCNGTTTTAGCS